MVPTIKRVIVPRIAPRMIANICRMFFLLLERETRVGVALAFFIQVRSGHLRLEPESGYRCAQKRIDFVKSAELK